MYINIYEICPCYFYLHTISESEGYFLRIYVFYTIPLPQHNNYYQLKGKVNS